jgi:hypothetical protein
MKNQKNTIKTNNTQDKKTTQEDLINTNRLNIRYKYKPFISLIGNYSFIEWGVYCYLDTPKQELQTFIKNDVFKYLELKKC